MSLALTVSFVALCVLAALGAFGYLMDSQVDREDHKKDR